METGLQYIRTTRDSYVYFPDAASYLNSGWVSSFARKPGQSPAKYRSFLPPSHQSARAFSHHANMQNFLPPSLECRSFLPLSVLSARAFYLYPSRVLELTTSIPLERRSFLSLSLQSSGAFYLYTFRVGVFYLYPSKVPEPITCIPPGCRRFLPCQKN
jgi:hypothetical protein